MKFTIDFTRAALETIRRSGIPLERVRLWLDDHYVDDRPEQIDSSCDPAKRSASALVNREAAKLALSNLGSMPTAADTPAAVEPSCESCLFTGRMPDREVLSLKRPGAAVCVHRGVPLLQRRSAARSIFGRCGPDARLRKAEGPR